MKLKIIKPQLVCSHGTERAPFLEGETIVVDDCAEARSADYWRARTPPGVNLNVTLWEHGWGRPGERFNVLRLYGHETAAPPVDGSMPTRIPIVLPNGAVREAVLMPVGKGTTYGLQLKPGDCELTSSWESMVSTRPAVAMPSKATMAIRKRLRAKRKAAGGTD